MADVLILLCSAGLLYQWCGRCLLLMYGSDEAVPRRFQSDFGWLRRFLPGVRAMVLPPSNLAISI
jgi:hypothetical protein